MTSGGDLFFFSLPAAHLCARPSPKYEVARVTSTRVCRNRLDELSSATCKLYMTAFVSPQCRAASPLPACGLPQLGVGYGRTEFDSIIATNTTFLPTWLQGFLLDPRQFVATVLHCLSEPPCTLLHSCCCSRSTAELKTPSPLSRHAVLNLGGHASPCGDCGHRSRHQPDGPLFVTHYGTDEYHN